MDEAVRLIPSDIACHSIRIQLSCATYDGCFEITDREIQRIYLRSSAPLLSLWTNKWCHALGISELFRKGLQDPLLNHFVLEEGRKMDSIEDERGFTG